MIKTKTLLSAASVIALLAIAPAHADTATRADTNMKTGVSTSSSAAQADVRSDVTTTSETERTQNADDTEVITESEIEQGWENTKDTVSSAANDASDAIGDATESVRSAFSTQSSADAESDMLNIKMRNTASGMIGENIYDTQGERIGTVNDIILDSEGQAAMVIVGDGDFFGFGKQAAFDYDIITNSTADGDVIAALSEEMIDQAAEFSYNTADASDQIKVLPTSGYSVKELLDSQLVNEQNEEVAEVDNITFENGQASKLIVSFDEVLGMGGEKAAMSYQEARVVKDGSGYDFQLDSNQSMQFENFKQRN